jgi:hypothetical protein
MSLDLIGRIHDNPEIALRMKFEAASAPESIRIKAATYDRWRGRSWSAPRLDRLRRENGSAESLPPAAAGRVGGAGSFSSRSAP